MPLDNAFTRFLKQQFDISLMPPEPVGIGKDRHEMAVSDMLPYTFHYDDQTVITKDDGLVQVIKLNGLFFESLSDEQIKQFERRRNTVLRSIANSDIGIYVHLVRRKVSEYPEGEGQAWFARYFNNKWREQYGQRPFFVNELYLSIVRNRFRRGAPGVIDRAVAALTGDKADHENLETFAEQARHLNDVADKVLKGFAAYGARKLGTLHIDTGNYSEIGRFLHYLVNLEDRPFLVSDLPLGKALATSRLNFTMRGRTMEVEGVAHRRAATVLSMLEWPARTSSKMLDDFLRQPVEFIITQSFFFVDRITAEYDMQLQKRRMQTNRDIATDQIEEITKGLQDLGAGRAVNGLHHLSILVHVPCDVSLNDHSRREAHVRLDEAVKLLNDAFTGIGIKSLREYYALEAFYWSQLPGQSQKYIGRRGKINSVNFAGFASLHNFAIGRIDGNLWGPAIMPFETESGTAYHFNFHREIEGMVAGHTVFTADTGAGKTTLLSSLIAMADKAAPRVFWFDNRHGAEVFMRAMGGQHTLLTATGHTGWNPFQLPDTEENRLYLVDLLTLMRTCYGGTVNADEVKQFKKAVQENYQLPFKDRRLQNIAWCFGQGRLAKDMAIWHGTGANAGVFDNATDSIDLSRCRHYCYEMRQLIKDLEARPELAVILSYPFHRIEQAMDGAPFIIVLEEGQNLVRHSYWRNKIDSYIMQIRRKNGLLIFVTPDPKYIYSETDSLQKQAATKIFLPNGEAQREDYVEKLGLTEAEYEFVRNTPIESRKFLIRRGNESIRAVFDLSPLPELIPVLSSNDKGVALMHAVMSELGTEDPAEWVPEFMRRSLEANTHNLTRLEEAA